MKNGAAIPPPGAMPPGMMMPGMPGMPMPGSKLRVHFILYKKDAVITIVHFFLSFNNVCVFVSFQS